MTRLTRPAAPVREIVELACRAPSVHNTQPWLWHADQERLRLYADRERQLPHSDPEGRNVVLSCGAALHHARVAAEGLGWEVDVVRCPDPGEPDLLATVVLAPGRAAPEAEELLEALQVRSTDRRRFTSWPLPVERIQGLAAQAEEWGALVLPVIDPDRRALVEELLGRAHEEHRFDPEYDAEVAPWVDADGPDGVSVADVLEPGGTSEGAGEGASGPVEGLLALCTVDDDPAAWLRCGESLSALWLLVVRHGLSLLPLSEVVEVPGTRERLRRDVLDGQGHPQLLVRLGWQEIAQGTLPRTPRRPVEEVLRLD